MKRLFFFFSLILLMFSAACGNMPISGGADAGQEMPAVITATAGPGETPAPPAADPAQVPAAEVTAPSEPASAPQSGVSDEQFDAMLIEAIERKDFESLRSLMGPRFILAGWRSEGRELSPEDALEEMRQNALSSGATPAASTGMDTVALLEGADPLNFFPPDAARAVYFDFVGSNATDQALAIIGRDPATGQRYWKGLLVAMGGFRSSGGDLGDLNLFSEKLTGAVLMHDFDAMRAMMGSQFAFAQLDPTTLDGSLTVVPADEAIHQLRSGALAQGSDPVILRNTDIPALIGGHDPLAQWGPNAAPIRAVHISSLGQSNRGEGVLVIGREPSGRLYWHGILQPLKGETFQSPPLEPVGDARPTSVRYVEALEDLNARSGPGISFTVEGRVRAGEVAQVSGVSADGGWWQIYCTVDSSGRCWISADPSLSQPRANP